MTGKKYNGSVMEQLEQVNARIKDASGLHVCIACNSPITDSHLLKTNNQYWHEHCLKCFQCEQLLSTTCYLKHGKVFCLEHYASLFGQKCSACGGTLSRDQLVMQTSDQLFHPDCFKCDECGDKLEKGDEFIMKDTRLYCSADFNVLDAKLDMDVFSSDDTESVVTTSPTSFDKNCCKRPRTILTTQQRQDFKAAFELTPKPCRKVREQLSNNTGLSVRVVQVWFQNQRAKLKKLQRKADVGSVEKTKKTNNRILKKKRTKSKSLSSPPTLECDDTTPTDDVVVSSLASLMELTDNYDSRCCYSSRTSTQYCNTNSHSNDFLSNNFENFQYNLPMHQHNRLPSDQRPSANQFQLLPHLINSYL